MQKYEITIIIPTFNEIDNVENIVVAVFNILQKNELKGEILVVDDDSRDGTAEAVRKLQSVYKDVHLIVRHEDHGLSQSVVEGFDNAQADVLQVIDADFSHPVELIPEFYQKVAVGGYDVVIGSRYTRGGDIRDWPLKRRIISLGATVFGRVLFPEITDPVSGFFAVKKSVVTGASMKPRGYKILMEVLGKGHWQTFTEIPFVFKDREEGESKLRLSTMVEYLQQCVDIGWYALGNSQSHVWKEWLKLAKFGIVGLSGIFVNTGLLYALTEYANLYYMVSAIFAIEASIATNFLLNDFWTFDGGNESRMGKRCHRFVSFQMVSVLGVGINMAILFLLTEYAHIWYILSNIIGIFVAFAWNFFVNRNLTWRRAI